MAPPAPPASTTTTTSTTGTDDDRHDDDGGHHDHRELIVAASPLLEADAACALLLAACHPLPSERVLPGPAIVGRVLAEPVRAALDLPPFPSSAMDGYAVRARDAGPSLAVAFRAAAGEDPPPLPEGTAAGVTTGGVVPDGADAVVPIERVRERDGVVSFEGDVHEGDHVRHPGSDVLRGSEVLPAGAPVVPLALAAVSAAGIAEIVVHRRPRVAVVVTGDELRTPPEPLRRGQIYESNGSFLGARSVALGAELVRVERVADDADATREAFVRALADADLVLCSGGVSVGPARPREAGAARPRRRASSSGASPCSRASPRGQARPTGAWSSRSPATRSRSSRASSCSCGRCSAGSRACTTRCRLRLRLPLSEPVRRLPDRMRAVPSLLEPSSVRPLGAGLSHQLGRAALADALALVPAGGADASVGELVDVLSLA